VRLSPWPFVAVLAVGVLPASMALTQAGLPTGVTYVFTPMVDVIPGGSPLGAAEAEAVQQDLRTQVDARDVQRAYARLGSTMSLDDLLRGVESLPQAGVPLAPAQARSIGETLARARQQHAELRAVQKEILDLEARLASETSALGGAP
jgi:hypothetical protein